MNADSEILILGETSEDGAVSGPTLELLGLARTLADEIPARLASAFIGADLEEAAHQSIQYGADRAYLIHSPLFSSHEPYQHLQALHELAAESNPACVLAPHNALWQDLLPRLAARLKTQVVTDCVSVAWECHSRSLLMTKPVYGGNALAVFRCDSHPRMATVRRGSGPKPESALGRTGELIRREVIPDSTAPRTKVIERIKEETGGGKLDCAPVVVAGGRGIGRAEGFNLLRELAELLGGAVGASRPACDMGWIPYSCQVGLTGKIVAPNLYFAIAISGAMQHLTGMSESKLVVAINRDASAPIFKYADYGIVGDYREALPSLIETLKELRGAHARTVNNERS
ncbi:MAG: electron transfer flavoprotein subunit alpha/FixB family protein [Candidatus Abyssubacteria bacterium]